MIYTYDIYVYIFIYTRMIIRSDSRICHFQRIIWNPFIWRYLSLLVRGSMVLFDEQINREYYTDKYSWRFALSPQLIICIFVEMPLMCLRNHPWSPSRIPRTRLSSHYTYYLLISEWMIVHETRMVIHILWRRNDIPIRLTLFKYSTTIIIRTKNYYLMVWY